MEALIFLWIILSIGVGYLASERGRSWLGWSLLSLISSPLLGVVIVMLSSDLKTDSANREREERRHREQLAALASSKPQDAIGQPSVPPGLQASGPAAEADPHHPATSLFVADELEKLGALMGRGFLTTEEFTRQKARLLGDNLQATTASSPAKPEPPMDPLEAIARGS